MGSSRVVARLFAGEAGMYETCVDSSGFIATQAHLNLSSVREFLCFPFSLSLCRYIACSMFPRRLTPWSPHTYFTTRFQ